MSDDLFPEPEIALPSMPLSEHVVEDYVATGLSLEGASGALLPRAISRARGIMRNVDHRSEALPQDMTVTVAGLVLMRQMPGAKGVVFVTWRTRPTSPTSSSGPRCSPGTGAR